MHDLTGQTFGKHRLIRLLRDNEFAQIYLGEHIFLKRQAVVKVLQGHVTAELQAAFLKEAQLIASLEHPHIVRVLDFGIEHQHSFLVMSYAPNGTLRQRHPEGSQLPFPLIVTYLQRIASALQYAHEHHVIHRDVKPQHMLVGSNDEILLSDFGLAVIFESTSSQNLLQQPGTLTYMAPEQFQGKAYPASDQYALAVVAYEWLCGEPPFQGTDREIAIQHQFAPPPFLHEKVPALPTTLEQVVLKALAKDPSARFASVQDFATAFGQMARSPIAPSRSPVSSMVPHRERARAWTHILLGLMAIIIIGSLGLFASAFIIHHARVPVAAPLKPSAIATAAAHAYATATSKGVMFGFDAQHTNFNPYERVLNATNVSHLVLDWAVSLGSYIYSSPTVANGVVYIGSDDNKLYAIDALTGKLRWASPTGADIVSSPAVVNGVVYIGSDDHKLYAFDASTGKLRWATPTSDSMGSAPVVVNGVVYTGSDGSNLYAFAASSGKQLWASPLGSVSILSPAVTSNTVYIVSSDLYAFNASTGELLWSTANVPAPFEGGTAPTIANHAVYVGSGDGKLYAFDASTGKLLCSTTNALVTLAGDTALAAANHIIYAGSDDGKLYAFDASTCKLLWSTLAGGHTTSSPAVANGVVYIGSSYNLYAFDASTGKQLWAAPTGNWVYSSPAVANGMVYVGSGDGKLYAFHLPSLVSQ